MQNITTEMMILEERKFLHDLSNKMVIAQGMANIVLSKMQKIDGIDVAILDKQTKAIAALNAQVQLLKDRREVLHARS